MRDISRPQGRQQTAARPSLPRPRGAGVHGPSAACAPRLAPCHHWQLRKRVRAGLLAAGWEARASRAPTWSRGTRRCSGTSRPARMQSSWRSALKFSDNTVRLRCCVAIIAGDQWSGARSVRGRAIRGRELDLRGSLGDSQARIPIGTRGSGGGSAGPCQSAKLQRPRRKSVACGPQPRCAFLLSTV